MKTAFYTLGCKLNQCESEALASSFKSRGFSIVPPNRQAEIYILNSCTVTSMAEQKARRMIRKFALQNSESVIIVTGCYAELDDRELEALVPNLVAVGMDGKSRLLDLPQYIESNATSCVPLIDLVRDFLNQSPTAESIDRFRFNVDHYSFHSRAFIKIQDGCNHRCSYCRIPLARGKAVSLPLDQVLKRMRVLLEKGYREIVLTGVNISAWRDWQRDSSLKLADLILSGADLAEQYGARIRLSSLEPDQLTASLLHALQHPAVTPHLHLPLQSLSQSVLTRMNRHYKVEKVIDWVCEAKEKLNDPFLGADIITGFDGESAQEFREGFLKVEQMGCSHLHVFPFSPREGTVAQTPIHPVAERIRDERAALYRELSEKGLSEYWRRSCGRLSGMLIESIQEEYVVKIGGLTDNYLRPQLLLDRQTFQKAGFSLRQIIPIRLDLNDLGQLVAQWMP